MTGARGEGPSGEEAVFDIAVRRQMGEREIVWRFRSDARLTAVVGPSGAGKTSLLAMVAGLLRPDAGHIAVGGETLFDSTAGIDRPAERRRIGYVFQEARLFPHRRVAANLAYGRRGAVGALGMTLEDMADFLGIDGLLGRWPGSLSGGEAQRVAIGRALLSDPACLLMDEPLAALDRARREDIMTLIERIRDRLAVPILYVSHDAEEVKRLSGKIVAYAGN